MDVPAILAIIGGIALLIGLLGGGIKAKEVELPKVPYSGRIIAAIVGVVLMAIAIWLSTPKVASPSPVNNRIETYSVQVNANNHNGVSSGISVKKGDVLSFQAPGDWCWGNNPDCSTANGTNGRPSSSECCSVATGANLGELFGQINDWVFIIGIEETITAEQDGQLILQMNDLEDYYFDNSGSITVQVTIIKND